MFNETKKLLEEMKKIKKQAASQMEQKWVYFIFYFSFHHKF